MAFPPAFLDEIRARVPLAGVIGRKVRLQKRGREHSGLCPFHNEKTPSFTVSEDKGFYHCFGCGAHGDVIGFVMQSDGLSFPDAVEKLAAEAGLEVPKSAPEDRAAERRRADLHDVLEQAAGWFEDKLGGVGGSEARAYLERRGLTTATIAAFRLGYAPNQRGALRRALNAKGINDDLLEQAGLIKPAGDGGAGAPAGEPRDYFFDRVIFPITDRRGRVVAFGGRALGDSPAKYVNSPDGPLFHKGQLLFNLSRAREALRATAGSGGGELLVAEGYMDVIALAQSGFAAAVAPLGTAITEQQIAALWRLAPEPVLCLDGDAAGRRAAFRAIERALPLLQPGQSLRFALLPEGEDPDSLLRLRGAAALRQAIDGAQPLAAMLWVWQVQEQGQGAGQGGGRFDTPERRTALWKALTGAVARIPDAELQEAFRMEMAERFNAAFGYRPGGRWRGRKGEAGGAGRRGAGSPGRSSPATGWPAARATPPLLIGRARSGRPDQQLRRRQEQVLVASFINHPVLLSERAEDLAALDLEDPELRRLSQALLDRAAQGGPGGIQGVPDLDTADLRCHLSELGYSKLLGRLLDSRVYIHGTCARPDTPLVTVRAVWDELAAEFRHRLADAETQEAANRLAADGSEENLVRLQAKQRLSGGDGGRKVDADGYRGAGSFESD
jgi:DNA primase